MADLSTISMCVRVLTGSRGIHICDAGLGCRARATGLTQEQTGDSHSWMQSSILNGEMHWTKTILRVSTYSQVNRAYDIFPTFLRKKVPLGLGVIGGCWEDGISAPWTSFAPKQNFHSCISKSRTHKKFHILARVEHRTMSKYYVILRHAVSFKLSIRAERSRKNVRK